MSFLGSGSNYMNQSYQGSGGFSSFGNTGGGFGMNPMMNSGYGNS